MKDKNFMFKVISVILLSLVSFNSSNTFRGETSQDLTLQTLINARKNLRSGDFDIAQELASELIGSKETDQIVKVDAYIMLGEIAGLKKDVVLVGELKFFEIWDKERWDEEFERAKESFPEVSQSLSELGI